jgi:hypothetical protein
MAGRAAKGRSSQGAQGPSHAGICQTGAVGEGGALPARNQLTGPWLVSGRGAKLELSATLWSGCATASLATQTGTNQHHTK